MVDGEGGLASVHGVTAGGDEARDGATLVVAVLDVVVVLDLGRDLGRHCVWCYGGCVVKKEGKEDERKKEESEERMWSVWSTRQDGLKY